LATETVAEAAPATASPTDRSVGHRLGVVTIDQIVSGGSNLLASVLAARTLNPSDFGLFGLVFLVYVVVQGASRAMICNPVLVKPVEARERIREVLGSGVLFGLCWAGLVAVGAGAVHPWDHRLAWALVTLAACLPLLMLQDLGRFLAIAFLEPAVALWLDLIWLVLMVMAVSGLAFAGVHSLVAIMLAWAGTGAVAGLAVLVRWHSGAVRLSKAWLSDTWGLAWRFAITFITLQVSVLGLAGLMRDLYGAAVLGALLGAQLFMRPYSTIDVAISGSAVAEISHQANDRSFVWRHVRRITVLAGVVAGLNAVAMLVLPDALGRIALGSTWAGAQHYMAPLAVQVLLLALTVGSRAGLVGTGHVDRLTVLNLVFIPVMLIAAVVGAVTGGPLGCAWGMTVGWGFAAVTWWLAFVAVEGRGRRSGRYRYTPRHSHAA
jgi:O-antigen/teichoic acid export membrane protein